MKDKIARMIASKMNDDQKRQMIQAFYEKNKLRPDVDKLVKDMKKALNYKKDDVPETKDIE